MVEKQESRVQQLIQEVISAMQAKKGQRVVLLDLRGIEKAVCDYFIICSADTPPHIRALADEWPWRSSGREGALWIVIDYIDVVVHVMTNETREFYGLEDLWADAVRTEFADE